MLKLLDAYNFDLRQKMDSKTEEVIRGECLVFLVLCNLIITLSLGSMKTDHVISEPCYSEVIYNRHIAK